MIYLLHRCISCLGMGIGVVHVSVFCISSSEQIDPKACNPRSMQKQKRNGGNWPKVFLGGLPSNLTETDLRNFFSRFGAVMEVVIMFDQEKKKSRGEQQYTLGLPIGLVITIGIQDNNLLPGHVL